MLADFVCKGPESILDIEGHIPRNVFALFPSKGAPGLSGKERMVTGVRQWTSRYMVSLWPNMLENCGMISVAGRWTIASRTLVVKGSSWFGFHVQGCYVP